uniref:Uncharacterized protein n=1 Tax=Dulem virus 39 TaxID=3145757 RepID=A0AAU8B643_9CAUD
MFNTNSTPFTMPVTPAYTSGGNCGNGMWGDGGWWVIILFALIFGWGRNGFGGGESGSSFTDSAVQRGFDNQSVMNKLNGIEQGICSLGYDQLSQMNGINQNVSQQGFNISSAIAQLGYQNQSCCCETNRNIDAVRYENAKNTCDIVNAIREDGALTRAQLTQNEIQGLRDQLQTANFQLSQQAQSANLINQLRPCPIPAYLSCSPYTSYDPYGRNGFFGNGCGCNSGCC